MNVTTTFVDENNGICKAQFNRMEHVWPVSSLACEWFILSNQNRNFGDEICGNRAHQAIRQLVLSSPSQLHPAASCCILRVFGYNEIKFLPKVDADNVSCAEFRVVTCLGSD